jgi:hypothetical protein
MVQAVIINLHLIIFDLTYFTLRPFYLRNIPQVTQFYDPFKGVESHRTTDKLLKLGEEYKVVLNGENSEAKSQQVQEITKSLTETTIQMIEENSFEKSGLTGNLQQIKEIAKREYRKYKNLSESVDVSSKESFRWFWTYEETTALNHYSIFHHEMKPLLEPNYYRHYGLNGKYVDEFFKLDVPFFVLFLIEFIAQWYIAVKRKIYVAWFLYPMYHWYDVLGLIPLAELRIFRLLRLTSMYFFIRKNVFHAKKDDIITRTIKYYSNIIKEELSDLVTVRILSEMQEEIRSGASRNLVTSAIESRREELKKLIIGNIRKAVTNSKANQAIRKLLGEALVKSTSTASSLQFVPAPLKEAITKDIGLSIFDAMNEVLTDKLTGESGEENVNKLVDSMIDDVIIGAQDSEFNQLNEDMTIEILENMKKAVSVKKWLKSEI